MNYHIQIL